MIQKIILVEIWNYTHKVGYSLNHIRIFKSIQKADRFTKIFNSKLNERARIAKTRNYMFAVLNKDLIQNFKVDKCDINRRFFIKICAGSNFNKLKKITCILMNKNNDFLNCRIGFDFSLANDICAFKKVGKFIEIKPVSKVCV